MAKSIRLRTETQKLVERERRRIREETRLEVSDAAVVDALVLEGLAAREAARAKGGRGKGGGA